MVSASHDTKAQTNHFRLQNRDLKKDPNKFGHWAHDTKLQTHKHNTLHKPYTQYTRSINFLKMSSRWKRCLETF